MRRCAFVGLTIVFAFVASPIVAQNVYTWANVGADWGTAANWGGTVPTGADTGLFNAASYPFEPNLAAPYAVGGVWSTGSGSVAVTGSALTLNSTTVNGNPSTGIEMDPGAGALMFSNSLGLGASQTWLNNSGSLLSIQGNVSTGGKTLTIAGSGNVAIGAAVSNAGNLTMVGAGTLQLYGANSFTGTTTADNGTVSMTGGTLASTIEYVGYNNTGNFVQSGGVVSTSNTGTLLWLGYNSASSSGSYTLSGGTLALERIRMGNLGTGNFVQTGGLVAPSIALSIAFSSAANYTLSGGQLSSPTCQLNVGTGASGSFTQSNGSVNVNVAAVGDLAGSSGTCNITGGSFTTNEAQLIGSSGNGTFIQSGGTNTFGTLAGGVAQGFTFMAVGYSATGSYTLTNGQVLGSSGTDELDIGDSASGSFNQSGGTVSVSSGIFMSNSTGASGSYTLSGSGVLAPNYMALGNFSSATFTQTGGTNLVVGAPGHFSMDVGQSEGGVGNYVLNSGLLSAAFQVIGDNGVAIFTQTGGTNMAAIGPGSNSTAAALVLGYDSDGSGAGSGTYNLNGGLLVVGGFGLQMNDLPAQFNASGGTFQAASSWGTGVPITLTSGSLTFDTSGNRVQLGGTVTGSGGLIYQDTGGGGSLIVEVANSYAGGTVITSGSLQIGDPGALGSGTLTVNGGTLDLSGLNIAVSGLSGGTAGTITNSVGGFVSLTVSQTGKTTFDGSIQDGAGQTALVLTSGTLALDGTNTYTGGTFVSGGRLVLANNEAIPDGSNLTVGDPTPFGVSLPSPVVAGGATADARSPVSKFNAGELGITALSSVSFDGVQSTAGSSILTPVPEPASLGLFIFGVAAAAAVYGRKGTMRGARSSLGNGALREKAWQPRVVGGPSKTYCPTHPIST